ncbi:hypothetical protein [Verrucosispora sp. TAA-831]|uniref:hypothetical protein n=1 Tax=Verrucosispora sp. TAA-831 TaxID=3422227 RepID=UPI003D6FBC66
MQTLSRRNRTHCTASGEQKRKTFVIDFVNKPEDIRTAVEPYFTNATLGTETDPYIVVHLFNRLAQIDKTSRMRLLDTVGGPHLVAAWGLLAPGGVLHSTGWASGEWAVFSVNATFAPDAAALR